MTQEEIDLTIDMARDSMNSAIEHLQFELTKIRTGKASASMFDTVYIEFYGAKSPVSQVATIKALDGRTLTIQPWEKSMLQQIERAIFEANMGVTPQNDGIQIRIVIPPLTEERRRDLVKQMGSHVEHAKVAIRNARREAIEDVKKAVKNGYSEDSGKRSEDLIQKLTDEFSAKADKLMELKEKDIMTI